MPDDPTRTQPSDGAWLRDLRDGEAWADHSAALPAVGAQPHAALAEDADRRSLFLYNPVGNSDLVVRIGDTAAGPFPLAAGKAWEPVVAPTNAVYLSGAEGDAYTLYAG